MLEKLDPKVTEEVVRFALARHGNDPEWKKRIGRLSFGSIAKLHLREFVKATEYKTTGGKENGEDVSGDREGEWVGRNLSCEVLQVYEGKMGKHRGTEMFRRLCKGVGRTFRTGR